VTVALTVAEVRTFAPQLADELEYPAALIQTWLDDVSSELSLPLFGDELAQKSAWRLWVCHRLTVTSRSNAAAAGPVTGKTVGRASVQYGAPVIAGSEADYGRTAYGQALQARINAACSGPLVG
jgi:hypothetical protein